MIKNRQEPTSKEQGTQNRKGFGQILVGDQGFFSSSRRPRPGNSLVQEASERFPIWGLGLPLLMVSLPWSFFDCIGSSTISRILGTDARPPLVDSLV